MIDDRMVVVVAIATACGGGAAGAGAAAAAAVRGVMLRAHDKTDLHVGDL